MKYMLGTMAAVFVLGGSWAAADEVGPVSSPLDPMTRPAMHVGDKETWRDKKGTEWNRTVVSIDETTVTFEGRDGCTATRRHEVFAQWEKWTNCPSSGSGTTSLTKGEIWPLETGKKWRYKYSGKNDKGRRWKGKERCKVKDQIRVKVPAGEFDTYHVVCNTDRIKRHYYISPEIGKNVMYKRVDKYGKQPARSHKLVSFEPAESD